MVRRRSFGDEFQDQVSNALTDARNCNQLRAREGSDILWKPLNGLRSAAKCADPKRIVFGEFKQVRHLRKQGGHRRVNHRPRLLKTMPVIPEIRYRESSLMMLP